MIPVSLPSVASASKENQSRGSDIVSTALAVEFSLDTSFPAVRQFNMTAKPKLWETHSEGRRYTIWRYHNWYEPHVAVEMRFDHRRRQFTHIRASLAEEWEPLPGGTVRDHLAAKKRAFAGQKRSAYGLTGILLLLKHKKECKKFQ
jgi:hypothetical protein